jgi:hypothetical protein
MTMLFTRHSAVAIAVPINDAAAAPAIQETSQVMNDYCDRYESRRDREECRRGEPYRDPYYRGDCRRDRDRR